MSDNYKNVLNDCRKLFDGIDPNRRAELIAQLFQEYCIYQDQSENIKRLAPLINTVAEALTKDIKDKEALRVGVKSVQMYLRTPPVEFFGETLYRLGFTDKDSIDEMLRIKPKDVVFGTFLMEYGLITQEQKDMAVMAQKRLFTIQEVYARILKQEFKENQPDLIESLRGVFQHFMIATSELEDDLRKSKSENIHDTLKRLENIIFETEKQSHHVLGIVDQIFNIKDDIQAGCNGIRDSITPANSSVYAGLDRIIECLNRLYSLNLELNTSQQLQDRIGQQMLKIIPTIQTFHDQLLKIARKLQLNLESVEMEEKGLTDVGYGGVEATERAKQDDVDDLLASLGL
jgi:chemotaxis regulatin CheY-phosphate phosphatase CheZ